MSSRPLSEDGECFALVAMHRPFDFQFAVLVGMLIGVTIFFRANPTLRDEMASQAVLSTSPYER